MLSVCIEFPVLLQLLHLNYPGVDQVLPQIDKCSATVALTG